MSIFSRFLCPPRHPAGKAVIINPNNGIVFINHKRAETYEFKRYLEVYLDPILVIDLPRSHFHELCRSGIHKKMTLEDGIILFAAASLADPMKYSLLTTFEDEAFQGSDNHLKDLYAQGILKTLSVKLFPFIVRKF